MKPSIFTNAPLAAKNVPHLSQVFEEKSIFHRECPLQMFIKTLLKS